MITGAIAAVLSRMPCARLRETLAIDENAAVLAGERDFVFFRLDWHGPVTQDGTTSRTSRGRAARIWVPLVPGRGYRVTASMAPVRRVAGAPLYVRAYLNGRRMASGQLPDDRFSDYVFDLDLAAARSNPNVIEFRASRLPERAQAGGRPPDRSLDDRGASQAAVSQPRRARGRTPGTREAAVIRSSSVAAPMAVSMDLSE